LRTFFATVTKSAERRRALHSLELTLVQLERAGVVLPSTTLDNLLVQRDDEDCVALKIVNLQSEQTLLKERRLARSRLPAIAFTSFTDARFVRPEGPTARHELVRSLANAAGELVTRRERLEMLVRLGVTRATAPEFVSRCS
jgi:hypothetical protein